jgi:hypothetical protein
MHNSFIARGYPNNLSGVLNFGKEQWLEIYAPPLPGKRYQEIYDNISSSFSNVLPSMEKDTVVFYTAVSAYKLIYVSAMHCFAWASLKTLKEKGVKTVLDGNSRIEINDAIADAAPFRWLNKFHSQANMKLRLLEMIRTVRQNAGIRKSIAGLYPALGGQGTWITGNPAQSEVLAYLGGRNKDALCIRPAAFPGGSRSSLPQDVKSSVENFTDSFLDGIISKEPSLAELLDVSVRNAMKGVLLGIAADVLSHESRIRRWKRGELVVTPVGNISYRILAAAWRMSGGTITAASHGNSYLTILPSNSINNGALLLFDKYAVSSYGERVLTEFTRRYFKGPLTSDCEIVMGISQYHALFERLQAGTRPNRIRKIMVVGFPIDYHYYPSLIENNSHAYAHLTLRLMRVLRAHGYHVMYKAHPDTISETKGFFDSDADEIITENFTSCHDSADCLLYMQPYTTSFGFGMMTRIPVVVLNNTSSSYWHPEALELLKRRASFVNVDAGDDSALRFNAVELVAAVERSIELDDPEIVKRFALWEGA